MCKILVFDEDVNVQTLVAHELTDDGFQVIRGRDCEALPRLVESERPQMVVMEIKLKYCDGLDLLEILRFKYYDLPIIVWTVSKNSRRDPRTIAADYYIVKSPQIEELKEKVYMALQASNITE